MPGLAARAGVSANTAWKRLTEWKRSGFVSGHVFVPHPGLFGVGLEMVRIQLAQLSPRAELLERLDLVDGVFQADANVGGGVVAITISDSPDSRARRAKILAGLPGVERVDAISTVWLPSPTRSLKSADLRLIAALRERPNAPISRLAHLLGISARTFTRRFRRLRETFAMLSCRVEDFSRFPTSVAEVTFTLESAVNSRKVAAEVARKFPEALELPAASRPPYAAHDHLHYLTEFGNVSQVEEMVASFSKYPGVTGASTRYPGRERYYGSWIDNRIHQALRSEPMVSVRPTGRGHVAGEAG